METHQIKTFDGKTLVKLSNIDFGTEIYVSNELSTLKKKINLANKEHGLTFEKDFLSLNHIKGDPEPIFEEISQKWGLKYEKNL